MAQINSIKASEGHRAFGKLLKRIFRSDEHLIIERDGFPVAVILSYQEYEKLVRPGKTQKSLTTLPPVMSLEEAYGSVTPLNQPEDFVVLREKAIEEKIEKTIEEMRKD